MIVDQVDILIYKITETFVRVLNVVCRFWLVLLTNRLLNLTKLRSRLSKKSIGSSRFCSFRAHHYISDQMRSLKDERAQTTAKVVIVAYCSCLHLLISRVLIITMFRSVIYNQSVDSSHFTL